MWHLQSDITDVKITFYSNDKELTHFMVKKKSQILFYFIINLFCLVYKMQARGFTQSNYETYGICLKKKLLGSDTLQWWRCH